MRIATDLRDELKVSPISDNLVNDLINNKPVESAVANVGVGDFSSFE